MEVEIVGRLWGERLVASLSSMYSHTHTPLSLSLSLSLSLTHSLTHVLLCLCVRVCARLCAYGLAGVCLCVRACARVPLRVSTRSLCVLVWCVRLV